MALINNVKRKISIARAITNLVQVSQFSSNPFLYWIVRSLLKKLQQALDEISNQIEK